MICFPHGSGVLKGIGSLTPPRKLSNLLGGRLSCQFQGRMDQMPIKNCVFSSSRHIYEILSVGICFLGVQHAKPAVIHLLQYQSSPIHQSNP